MKGNRSEAEVAADRAFLLGVMRSGGGRDVSAVDAAKLLNARRGQAAYERAIATGKSDEEAQAAARGAHITVQMVRRDIRSVTDQLHGAASAAAAVWLDDDIAMLSERIERALDLEGQIIADIDRSRQVRWSRTLGTKNAQGQVSPDSMVSFRQDGPADAALYAAFVRNAQLIVELHEQRRALRFGRQLLPIAGESATFAQMLTQAETPEQAREAALALWTREMESLYAAEQMGIGPATPELMEIEQMRLRRIKERSEMLRRYIPVIDAASGGRKGYEIIVKRIGAGELPPGSGGGA